MKARLAVKYYLNEIEQTPRYTFTRSPSKWRKNVIPAHLRKSAINRKTQNYFCKKLFIFTKC